MKTRKQKVVDILRQELGVVGDRAERTANMIINVLKYYQRSLNENNYYWGVIVKMLADYFGYDYQSMHEALKWEFLRIENPGKPPCARSTTSLTTDEAEKFYENIRIWALTEYQIYIPKPNEVI